MRLAICNCPSDIADQVIVDMFARNITKYVYMLPGCKKFYIVNGSQETICESLLFIPLVLGEHVEQAFNDLVEVVNNRRTSDITPIVNIFAKSPDNQGNGLKIAIISCPSHIARKMAGDLQRMNMIAYVSVMSGVQKIYSSEGNIKRDDEDLMMIYCVTHGEEKSDFMRIVTDSYPPAQSEMLFLPSLIVGSEFSQEIKKKMNKRY